MESHQKVRQDKNYHVVYQNNEWKVQGVDKDLTFDNKKSAIDQAKKIALQESKSVVIHTQKGKISSVVSNGRKFAKGQKILSANTKKRFSGSNVRNAIAIAMSKRND